MLLRMVAPYDVLGDGLRIAGIKQLLHHRLVSLGDELLQLVSGCAKPRSAHEVRHQRNVLVAHDSASKTRGLRVPCAVERSAYWLRKSNCSNRPLMIGAASSPRAFSSKVE